MRIEQLILSNLIYNDEFLRKTLPFLKKDYFHDQVEKKIFDVISNYVDKYNNSPSKSAVLVELENAKDISDDQFKESKEYVNKLDIIEDKDFQWCLDSAEKFCQDKALYNAIHQSIRIVDDSSKGNGLSKGAIPQILQDALGVSFDSSIGHDFMEDAEERFEFYNKKEERIPFDIDLLNKATKGGLPKKTLTCIMAPIGAGKSLAMCHFAANNLMQGKNVLYITLEMAEERIAERIDANLLDIKLDDLLDVPKNIFLKKIQRLEEKKLGKLIIKEYPTSSAGVGHFRHLLNELKIKKGFIPDIVYIDYINLCVSTRVKNAAANSYTIVKTIAEEIRGLAVEQNLPIVTATQAGRCLTLDTIVLEKTRGPIEIKDVNLCDEILGSDGNYVSVEHIFPIEKKKVYEITTKSGKKIRCSSNHIFPTTKGLSCLEGGMKIGDKLFVR